MPSDYDHSHILWQGSSTVPATAKLKNKQRQVITDSEICIRSFLSFFLFEILNTHFYQVTTRNVLLLNRFNSKIKTITSTVIQIIAGEYKDKIN